MSPVITSSMLQRNHLSPGSRLSKAEVEDFINNKGATLHREYSEIFFEYLGTAAIHNNMVYQLPNGDVIYTLDPNGLINPGEGYYYTREIFLDIVSSRR